MSKNTPNKTGTLSKGKGGVSCSVVLLDGETLDVPLDVSDIDCQTEIFPLFQLFCFCLDYCLKWAFMVKVYR